MTPSTAPPESSAGLKTETDALRAEVEAMKAVVSRRPTRAPSVPSGEAVRVLVAEDNEVNQEVMVQMLESLGVLADVVGDGEAALQALTSRPYPLVLMDCQMPRMDGYQAARAIRELDDEAAARVPIIAVTAHAFAGEREKVIAAGMDDYITKPVTVDALVAVLRNFLPDLGESNPASLRPKMDVAIPVLDPSVRRSRKVIGLFLTHVPAELEDIARAVATRDADLLQAAAHKLKGSCAGLGVLALGALASSFEALPVGDAARDVPLLRDEFARARAALEAELAAQGAA